MKHGKGNDLSRFAVTSSQPMSLMTPAEWADVASERLIVGSIVVFLKGEFLEGSSKIVMSPTGLYAVLSAKQVWVKWQDRLPVQHVAYSRMNGPLRDGLGDNDEAKWEPGPDGKKRNPWSLTWYVVLDAAQTREHFTFVTSTNYGSLAVDELVAQIVAMNQTRPGAIPVIRLEGSLRPHRQWGKVSAPRFPIVGWTGGVEPPPEPTPTSKSKFAVIEIGRKPAVAAAPNDQDEAS